MSDRDRLTRRLLGVRNAGEDEEDEEEGDEDYDGRGHGGPPSGSGCWARVPAVRPADLHADPDTET